jgi:hypothetical protein
MGIQYDEQGRPFTYVGGTTRRSYISPVAMGTGTRPTDGGGIYRTDYGWDQNRGEWTRGIDWGNVLTTGIGAIAGGAALAPLFSGGGGAAAGGGAAGSAAGGAGGAGAAGTLASTQIGTGFIPAITGGTGLASGAGGAAAAAGGAASAGAQAGSSSILSRVLRTLGGAAPIVGAMTAPRQSLQGGVNDVMNIPGVREMLDLKMGQARRADPLHEALVTMSQRLLPNSSRGGM